MESFYPSSTTVTRFDSRGREVPDPMPCAFVVPRPDVHRISTLDFHRSRLLEQRELMRRMLAEMQADSEHETLAEANDFSVEDPLDEDASQSDFELDDDDLDLVRTLAEREHRATLAAASNKIVETVTVPNNGA